MEIRRAWKQKKMASSTITRIILRPGKTKMNFNEQKSLLFGNEWVALNF
jgi:hypothetical protein